MGTVIVKASTCGEIIPLAVKTPMIVQAIKKRAQDSSGTRKDLIFVGEKVEV